MSGEHRLLLVLVLYQYFYYSTTEMLNLFKVPQIRIRTFFNKNKVIPLQCNFLSELYNFLHISFVYSTTEKWCIFNDGTAYKQMKTILPTLFTRNTKLPL